MPVAPLQSAARSTGLAICLGLLLTGCSTTKVDWASRVGDYTFDQAVIELGPPDKQATLSDGTRFADWMTRRGGVRRMPVGPHYTPGLSCYGPGYPTYVTYQTPDYFLRLVFASDGNLQEWKKLAR
jgi:hypothetical protein